MASRKRPLPPVPLFNGEVKKQTNTPTKKKKKPMESPPPHSGAIRSLPPPPARIIGPQWIWNKAAHIPLPTFPSTTPGNLAKGTIQSLQDYLRSTDLFPGLPLVWEEDDVCNCLAAELIHLVRYWWLYGSRAMPYLQGMGGVNEDEAKLAPHCSVQTAAQIIRWSIGYLPEWAKQQQKALLATAPPTYLEWALTERKKPWVSKVPPSTDKEIMDIEYTHIERTLRRRGIIQLCTTESREKYNKNKKKSDAVEYELCSIPVTSDNCVVRNCTNQALLPVLWKSSGLSIPSSVRNPATYFYTIDAVYRVYSLRGRCLECATSLVSLGSDDVASSRCYLSDSPSPR